MCICVHICGGWRERRKASEVLQGLGPGPKLEGAKQEGKKRYSWTDFLKLRLVSFLAGELYYVKWLKLLSFPLC